MSCLRNLLPLCISFCLISLTLGDYRNILRLCKIDCEFVNNLMSNYSCKIKAISRIRTAIYLDIFLKRPLNNVLVNMQVYKKNSIKYIPFMVNFTVNACQLVAGVGQTYLARFMMEWIRPHSNFNHSCPYIGYAYIKRLEPFADNIPGFISPGDYRVDLHFYEKTVKHWIGTVRGYGTMSAKPFISQDFD